MNDFRKNLFQVVFSTLICSSVFQSSFAYNATDLKQKKPATFRLILSRECNQKWGHCWAIPSPTISNGIIYVSDYSGIVSAIAQENGLVIWRYKTFDENYSSTPALNNSSVFVTTFDGLYSLDKQSGQYRWRSDAIFGYPSNPIIDNETVFFGGDNGRLYAYDEKSNSVKWNIRDEANFSSPIVNNGNLFVGTFLDYKHQNKLSFYSVNEQTGKINWKYSSKIEDEDFYSTPCITNGSVFVQSSLGNLYSFDEMSGKVNWISSLGNGFYPSVSSPYCDNGTIFVGAALGNPGGALYAIDAVTGSIKWKIKTKHEVQSSPTVSHGVVFFDGDDGLSAIDKLTGLLKWKFKPDGAISRVVIDHGIVYFKTKQGTLYAIDEDTGTL